MRTVRPVMLRDLYANPDLLDNNAAIPDDRQLRRALRRGLGSAIVFLQNTDNKQHYRDIVLSYCLRDIGYDTQSEGSKGPYLYFAICALGDPAYFENPVIERFLSTCQYHLAQQLTDLLLCFARDGHQASIEALRAKYAQFEAERKLRNGRTIDGWQWEYVASALLDIDGFTAFKRYVTDVGQYLRRVPDGHGLYYDWFISMANKKFGKRRASAFLDPSSASRRTEREQDAVRTLAITMAKDEDTWQSRRQSHTNQPLTAQDVHQWAQESVANGSRDGSIGRIFRKNSTDKEKLKLAQAILDEPDETVKGWMLRAFYRQPFPLGPEPLLPYLHTKNERLRDSAVGTLEVCHDEQVHEAAVRLLETQGLDSGGLALLEANYRRSDDAVIAVAMRHYRNNLPHFIVGVLGLIYTRHRSANAAPVLLRSYREGECAFCRFGIVQAMQRSGTLPPDILNECQYDSYEDTRKLARRLIGPTDPC